MQLLVSRSHNWLAYPQLWFAQVEAQFNTWNVTNEHTKFDYAVASLAQEFSVEVCGLILAIRSECLLHSEGLAHQTHGRV